MNPTTLAPTLAPTLADVVNREWIKRYGEPVESAAALESRVVRLEALLRPPQ